MKNANYYFTLILVIFTTLFAFFNMFQIVLVSSSVIQIVFNNLLPSLLPYMILISLCIHLGLLNLLGYFLQFIFCPLFHMSPYMSSLYFLSFFCGYPTNAKMIKESYLKGLISLSELNYLLSIACFASCSFIFVSLNLPYHQALLIYICHLSPSLIRALLHHQPYHFMSFKDACSSLRNPSLSFVDALKQSIVTSSNTFIYILGYMLVFQFLILSLDSIFSNALIPFIRGFLEFSSGTLYLTAYTTIFHRASLCFFLSFASCSVFMQIDNVLEGIPYSFFNFVKARFFHGLSSFFIYILLTLIL